VTRRLYVIGHPIGHSLSPVMHNAALRACGLDLEYRAADVPPDGLGSWITGFLMSDDLGFNVTVPHKEAVLSYVHEVSGDARLVGAVNTVLRSGSDGKTTLTGTNTDTVGFRRSLAEDAGASFRDQHVLLLGAGGAARAIALVALQDGAHELVVANRHVDRAEHLLGDLVKASTRTRCSAVSLDDPGAPEMVEAASIVVNATSVGLRSMEMPLDPAPMRPGSLAVDIVYDPPETAFLQAARKRGAHVLPGLGMLIHQAAAAFELWTGVRPPVDLMRMAAEEARRDT
jgi:shikimate dehydrogenase